MGDDKAICIGLACLVIGLPLLIAGLIMFIVGNSGGQINVELCCVKLSNTGSGDAFCSKWVTQTTCSGFPLPATEATADEVSFVLDADDVRTDTTYTMYLEYPRGSSVNIESVLSEDTGGNVYSGTVIDNSASPSLQTSCSAASGDGYPVAQRVKLASDVNLEKALGLTFTTTATVTDNDGSLVSDPLGKAMYTPRVRVDKDGMGTLQIIGVVLMVVGGIIAAPPLFVIASVCAN